MSTLEGALRNAGPAVREAPGIAAAMQYGEKGKNFNARKDDVETQIG